MPDSPPPRGDDDTADEDPGAVHPVEPAEGARDPGEDPADQERVHPVEPAEGARDDA